MRGVHLPIHTLQLFGSHCNCYFWDMRLKICWLTNMLFQFLETFFQRELSFCLKKVNHITINCKRPIVIRDPKIYKHFNGAAFCKYREFAVKTEVSKFFIFSQKNPLVKHFRKSESKFPRIFLFEKTGKKWNADPRHIVAGLKPLNYTIFKALGKKDGSRKQVHLWQVSKASQLQYYLVKILQDNEFFTWLKNALRFLSSALS